MKDTAYAGCFCDCQSFIQEDDLTWCAYIRRGSHFVDFIIVYYEMSTASLQLFIFDATCLFMYKGNEDIARTVRHVNRKPTYCCNLLTYTGLDCEPAFVPAGLVQNQSVLCIHGCQMYELTKIDRWFLGKLFSARLWRFPGLRAGREVGH